MLHLAQGFGHFGQDDLYAKSVPGRGTAQSSSHPCALQWKCNVSNRVKHLAQIIKRFEAPGRCAVAGTFRDRVPSVDVEVTRWSLTCCLAKFRLP